MPSASSQADLMAGLRSAIVWLILLRKSPCHHQKTHTCRTSMNLRMFGVSSPDVIWNPLGRSCPCTSPLPITHKHQRFKSSLYVWSRNACDVKHFHGFSRAGVLKGRLQCLPSAVIEHSLPTKANVLLHSGNVIAFFNSLMSGLVMPSFCSFMMRCTCSSTTALCVSVKR